MDQHEAGILRGSGHSLLDSVLGHDPNNRPAQIDRAPKGRGVTPEAFDSVVEDLIATLDKLKVPEKEKKELLGILGPLKAPGGAAITGRSV